MNYIVGQSPYKFLLLLLLQAAPPLLLFFALVLHSRGLKISKSKNVCPEWLRWGLVNRERVGKAHCVETLNCY